MGVSVDRAVLRRIERDVRGQVKTWKMQAAGIQRQGAIVGFRTTQARLLEAVTYTGLQREQMNQGNPGRYRSGELYSDLGFYASSDVDSGEGAWFGWPVDQDSYEYAAAQDAGKYGARFVDDERGPTGGRAATPRIPPAGALWEGAIAARETIRELMALAGFKHTGSA